MGKNPDFTKIAFANSAKGESFDAWKHQIESSTGKNFDELITETMEQVQVEPLYTAKCYDDMEHLGFTAGIAPFLFTYNSPEKRF